MNKWIFLLCYLVGFPQVSESQEITAYKTLGGVHFQMDTVSLGINQVLDIVSENPEAYAALKKAKNNYNVAGVLGFTGAILIAIPIATAIAGGSPEWALAGGGAVLLLGTIPLTRSFRSHTMQALDLYNNKFKTSRIRTDFRLYGIGAKICVRF